VVRSRCVEKVNTGLVAAAAVLWTTAALAEPLPHRRGALQVDGSLDDWRGPALTATWSHPREPAPGANTATARVVWDPSYLWVAFEVDDAEVHPPPDRVGDRRLYQWDSVEIYVDSQGNAGPEMDTSDFQFIVSCDGRHAVLQGDELSAGIPEFGVPKRERPSLAMRVAAVPRDGGYVLEIAIPWATIGVATPVAGHPLGLDLAFNDWLDDHPVLPEIDLDDPRIMVLIDQDRLDDVPVEDPDGIGWKARGEWIERSYRPWAWSGSGDFGYPEQWTKLELTGNAPAPERLLRRVGGWNLALMLMAVTALAALVLLLYLRWRHRDRVSTLMASLRALEQLEPSPAPPQMPDQEAPAAADPLPPPTSRPDAQVITDAVQRIAPAASLSQTSLATKIVWALDGRSGEEDTPEGLAHRCLDYLRTHLDESVSVASLARVVHVSPRTLQRGIKDALHRSPRELILAVKMKEARRLLETGALRVSEVAYRVGFDNPDHFSRRFKAYHGVPPSALSRSRP
jgi:AraC-like DNA-binding protein